MTRQLAHPEAGANTAHRQTSAKAKAKAQARTRKAKAQAPSGAKVHGEKEKGMFLHSMIGHALREERLSCSGRPPHVINGRRACQLQLP